MKKKAFLFIGLITMLFVMLASCNSNKTVKISFDAQGGSKCQTVTIDDQTESVDLPDTTRDNFIFKGWYFDEGLTKQVPDPLPKDQFPTESTTFYAGWEEIYYTITFRVGNNTLKEKTCYLNDRITEADQAAVIEAVQAFFRK